jgi:SAM-dependent MidA family methyltransferase
LNALAEIIRSEIARNGALSCARFMELALYHPVHGYYERDASTVGRRGDFFTSVSVGSLFGELLAFQFAEWLAEYFETPEAASWPTCQIVEAGAHDGRLAADILGHLREYRPALFDRLEYWIVEPSARRRTWQRETLRPFEGLVRWCSSLAGLTSQPRSGIHGVVFSNELLDAFPVHRLGWDTKETRWFEWGVGFDGGRFAWTRLAGDLPLKACQPLATFHQPSVELPPALLAVLPDGFTVEAGPAAIHWWQQAAQALEWGVLLTLDYGLHAEEFFAPQRAAGTLRAYQGHHEVADLLAEPGAQDLTAHVNFTALQAAGEAIGLTTEGLLRQAKFLTRIFAATQESPAQFPAWTPERVRQFQTLTHPEHLGRPFQVLLQSAGPGE